jgi:hypothetical protein
LIISSSQVVAAVGVQAAVLMVAAVVVLAAFAQAQISSAKEAHTR